MNQDATDKTGETQESDRRPLMMLVDDSAPLRERLAKALRKRGYEVQTAGNYDEAIALAHEESPELAVVDLRMPGRNGLELLRDLLAIDATTKIVVMTGYGSIATAIEAMRLGAKYYISKPATVEDILNAFERGENPPLTDMQAAQPLPSLARAEWEYIERVLTACGGNISEAARRLGMHRRSLQRKIHRAPPKN